MTTTERAAVIASNVRAEMARKRKRGTELAALLGISQAAASRRLTGETSLDVGEVCAIAEWMDVPITDLMAGVIKTAFMSPFSGVSADLVAA